MDKKILFRLKNLISKKYEIQNWKLKNLKVKQRNENKWKFVIKKGFKFLYKKFKAKNNHFITGTKLKDEEEFYKYYFLKDS